MELFRADLVKNNRGNAGLIKAAVICFFVFLMMSGFKRTMPYSYWPLVVLAGYVVLMTLMGTDLTSYRIEGSLQVFHDRLIVDQLLIPYTDIEGLKFLFDGHCQLYPKGIRKRKGWSAGEERLVSNGIHNEVSFRYRGQDFNYRFFLSGPEHTQVYTAMLQELQGADVPFTAENAY